MKEKSTLLELIKDITIEMFDDSTGKVLLGFFYTSLLIWNIILIISLFLIFFTENGVAIFGVIGDSFNIGTSLFAALTVFLVAYSINIQRKELKRMGKELEENQEILKSQNKHHQDSVKNETTLNLMKEFTDIFSSRYGDSSSTGGRNSTAIQNEVNIFLGKLMVLSKSSMSENIDFKSIKSLILEMKKTKNIRINRDKEDFLHPEDT